MLRDFFKDLVAEGINIDQEFIGTETTLSADQIAEEAEAQAVAQGTFSIGVLIKKLDEILQKLAAALFC